MEKSMFSYKIIENNFLKLALLFSGLALFQPDWFTWIKPHIPVFLGIIMFGMGVTLQFKDLAIVWKKTATYCRRTYFSVRFYADDCILYW